MGMEMVGMEQNPCEKSAVSFVSGMTWGQIIVVWIGTKQIITYIYTNLISFTPVLIPHTYMIKKVNNTPEK